MDKESDVLCTINEACFTEKACRTTIYKRINLGFYKAFKIGGSTRINVASLKAYRQQFQPMPPATTEPPTTDQGTAKPTKVAAVNADGGSHD